MTVQNRPAAILRRSSSEITATHPAPKAQAALPSFSSLPKRRRRWPKWVARLIFIVAPLAIAYYYISYVAPQMYVSEARFAIRGSDPHGSPSGLGGLLSGGGIALLDGYAVRDFLQSSDALNLLETFDGYTARMAEKTDDWLFRLPVKSTFEEKLAFYRRNVSVFYGLTEQVVIVKSYSFTPTDAQVITARLVSLAATFANDANARSRSDTLQVAQEEVDKGEKRLTEARLAVNAWRLQNQNIDPNLNISMVQSIITALEGKLAEARAEMAEISGELGPDSQQRKQLARRIRALEDQIAEQRLKLVNTTDSSAAKQLLEYERLQIQVEFATKQLLGAQAALDEARINVIRLQKYVSQIVAATLPETPDFPNPYYILPAVFVLSLVVYAIFSLFMAMARETHV